MKRITLILVCIVFYGHIYAAEVPDEAPAPIWLKSLKFLTCTPRHLFKGDTLTLRLGLPHGSELGIRRESDNKWYYLILRDLSGYDGMKNMMDVATFSTIREVNINTDVIAFDASISPGGNEPIFTASGKYDIYVSTALESEDGGYKCVVDYLGSRSPKH
jgi:hypothetical protein